MKMTKSAKAAYGIGAVGKDMVYALSASFVMYFYQDLIGLSATFVGGVLMAARILDALNDPLMGVLVAKTNTRFGRFTPWLFSGSVLNAFVLYALYAVPDIGKSGMMVYFTVVYLLWGVTYTMMDIPYWSMIPAIADTLDEREKLSVIGRTFAGIGYNIISMGTVLFVGIFGGGDETKGFRTVALIVAVLFVICEAICCFFIKERKTEAHRSASVKEMFRALFRNDQAIVIVLTIVFINTALYLTSNYLIYFFKYDFGGEGWRKSYTLFTTVGGGLQILSMMGIYPLLRKKVTNQRIFVLSVLSAVIGDVVLLTLCLLGFSNVLWLISFPGAFYFAANGILGVLTTVFLSSSVDYGEMKTGNREESVIFSMQTFVVKAASGFAVFVAGLGIDLIGLAEDTSDGLGTVSPSTLTGLRILMTVPPIILLLIALVFFKRKFKLTDSYAKEIAGELEKRRG